LQIDNKQTCDYLVDASIKTMKYLNDPHDGCIRPQNHIVLIPKDDIDSFLKFSSDSLIINFPCKRVLHKKSLD